MQNGLAAWAIGVLVITGAGACSSGGGSGSSGGSATSPLTGSSLPSWAKSLGPGVQVIPPGSASPGNGTPADVVAGVIAAIGAKNYKNFCSYVEPSQQSTCTSEIAQIPAGTLDNMFKGFGSLKPTYTVIDGDQALVGLTGTVCSNGTCNTNSDPTAVLDSGKPFSQLWSTVVNSTSGAYEPEPIVKVNGKWYGQGSF